jgi:hypothetical protein
MSILNRVLGTAERTARGAASGRGGRGGYRAARRPAPRRGGYGRRTPTTSGGGIASMVSGLLRRR